ncbi:hypothetical protein, partial [Nocardia sp. NRRL S-836]|uniref:hypothetical protein n=1 Tax=Nocardia sp. NRRL S-836 TaxID=1519492 RepID=UPI0006C0B64D
MAARGETQANVEVSTLVVPAWQLRWRAPELALVLGERALALASARRDVPDRLRAEALVVFAGNRVGRGVRVADRALDALKAAEAAGDHETAWLLRVELAGCARSVGAPLTGFAAVTPVLEAADVPAELRASALVQASECLVTVGRGDEPTRALAEADQLYVADTELDEDMRLVLRGLIRAVQAAQHRRWGDIAAAIGAAREGLDLLSRLADQSADSGQAHGRLTLELVLALMDANRLLDASAVATPMLDRPVRAPGASTASWLRLALATRVHLPAGRVAVARDMLADAAATAERHQLDTLLAESLLALAHVHELSGDLADALTNLRAAHAAERRRARAVYAVRARLAAEFSGVHRQPADLHQQLASVLRPIEGMPKPSDGILPAALKQQLRQWRPVQVRKGDGLKVKRARRAAEDMTVEGLSAARAHAADRWRMVQPFGEPDDKNPEPVEPPLSSERSVPASGLIASAGAMVSGRRRAARVAAGEIEDTTPAAAPAAPTPPPAPASSPVSPPDASSPVPPPPASPVPPPAASSVSSVPAEQQLSPDQERKRKVEQQLMELQREARRQIEVERQARAEERAKADREARKAAEEAARQEAALQEAARQVAAREAARLEAVRAQAARVEAVRQEAARQEAARLEAARQEVAREEAARQEALRASAEREEAALREAARRQVARRQATARAAGADDDTTLIDAIRPDTVLPDTVLPDASRPDAARSVADSSDAARPDGDRFDAARSDVARPNTDRLNADRFDADRFDAARSDAARSDAARPDAAVADASRTDASHADATTSGAAHADAPTFDAVRADGARADVARADGARSDATGADAIRPDSAQADASPLGASSSDAASRSSSPFEADRQETLRTRSPFAQSPSSPSSEESVLDKLKAQGLRAGGRRRAPEATPPAAAEPQPEASSWRVEPPSRLRDDRAPAYSDDAADPVPSQPFFADLSTTPAAPAPSSYSTDHPPSPAQDTPAPDYFAASGTPASPDTPDHPTRSGLAAAFSRPPAAPDFGPHFDDPSPVGLPATNNRLPSADPGYPLFTPSSGFPAATPTEPTPSPASAAEPEPAELQLPDLKLPDLTLPELKLPELDFSSLELGDLATRSEASTS